MRQNNILCLIAMATLLGWPACQQQPEQTVSGPAQEFSLRDLEGNVVNLKDFHGDVILLEFWASWCGPCHLAAPMIEALHEKYVSQGLRVLAINMGESREVANLYAFQTGVTYPVLLDFDHEVAASFGVVGLPHFVLIDRKGKIQENLGGFHSRLGFYLEREIQRLL